MAIPTSAVALSLIQGEFGGENPISLSEYYRTPPPPGTFFVTSTPVRPEVTSVPLSGTISFGNFAGVSQPVPNTSKIGIVQDGFIFKGAPLFKSLVAEVSVTGSPNTGGPLRNRYVNVSGLLYNKPFRGFEQADDGVVNFTVSTNVPASTSDFTNITITNNLGTFSISRASMTNSFTSGAYNVMYYQTTTTQDFFFNVTAGVSVIVCIN